MSYKYSAESDYWSHAFWASLSRTFWGNTATVGAFGGFSLDSVGFRPDAAVRRRSCQGAPADDSCPENSVFGGVGYTQVLSPVAVAQLNLDTAYLDGFLANPYRQVAGIGYEVFPDRRLRTAVSVRGAYYFPRSKPVCRFSTVTTATFILARFHRRERRSLGPLRQHGRGAYLSPPQPRPGGAVPLSHVLPAAAGVLVRRSGQRRLQADVGPRVIEVRFVRPGDRPCPHAVPGGQADVGRRLLGVIPFFRWFAAGTFEISYGRYFQNNSFGDAHVLQAGYSMPY